MKPLGLVVVAWVLTTSFGLSQEADPLVAVEASELRSFRQERQLGAIELQSGRHPSTVRPDGLGSGVLWIGAGPGGTEKGLFLKVPPDSRDGVFWTIGRTGNEPGTRRFEGLPNDRYRVELEAIVMGGMKAELCAVVIGASEDPTWRVVGCENRSERNDRGEFVGIAGLSTGDEWRGVTGELAGLKEPCTLFFCFRGQPSPEGSSAGMRNVRVYRLTE